MTPKPITIPARGGHALPVAQMLGHRGGHATAPGTGTTAPKGKTNPATGMPKMESAAELRAAANAQAWKSIQQMQAALPDEASIAARYGAQSAYITPLIDAHRKFLETAGQYHVQTTNALSSIVGNQNAATDQAQTGFAAAAGAPMGSAPVTNVSPGEGANVVTAPGGAFANYLHSLVPFANAVGGQALSKVNQNWNADLQTLDQSRKEIALKLPDLQASNYSTLSTNALSAYKGELAALVAGGKDTTTAVKAAETNRHNLAMEANGNRNAATAERRARDAFTLGKDKLNKTVDKTAVRSTTENGKLQSALATAIKMYDEKGGTTGYEQFKQVLSFAPPKVPSYMTAPPKQTKVITGSSAAEVAAKAAAFLKANNVKATGPVPNGVWSASDVPTGAGEKAPVGQKGDYTRRMEAWRYFTGVNAASAHPLSTSALQVIFRKAFGAPK